MKKIVCLLLTLVMLLTVMSACKPKEHVHTFDEAWQSDETDHWHQATCEHAEEIADKAPHEDLDSNGLCDICGYAMDHTHTYSDKWSFNQDEHYHAPTCGCNAKDKKYQKDNAPHVDENNDSLCDVCQYDYDHTHVYDMDNWTKADADYHWHAPSCGHNVDGIEKAPHADEDNDGICDFCEWDYDHTHTFAEEWSTDDDYHWYEATCGHKVVDQKNPHVDKDSDGICDDCGIKPEHIHQIDWDNWTSDSEYHWHAAIGECAQHVDSEGNAIVADYAKHDGWKEDGICDTCGHIVFHMYKVNVVLPGNSAIVNANGTPMLGADGNPVVMPFSVKEGTTLEFYVSVPSTHRLESVTGAEVDMVNYIKLDNADGSVTYLYKVTVAPTNDVTVTVTLSKLSSVEVVDSGKGSFVNSTGKAGYYYYDISFTAEETGRYVILCLKNDQIDFGPSGNVQSLSNTYEFTASAGQTVALQARYFSMDQETVNFEYHILKLDDTFILPYLEGEGFTLPAKVDTTFVFTLPEPGLYLFTSQVGNLQWISEDNASGTVEPQFFLCTYAGQQFTHTGKLVTDISVTYEFDWNIIKMESMGAVSVGENAVNVDVQHYVQYTFTAPYTGDYSFLEGENAYLSTYNRVYSNGIVTLKGYAGSTLVAGETIDLFLSVNTMLDSAPTQNFTDKLTITFDGYHPKVTSSGVNLLPGGSYTYEAPEKGYYTFSVPSGKYVRVNGGSWIAGSTGMLMTAGQTVKLEIKSSDNSEVKVSISSEALEHTLTMGAGSYAFYPGGQYDIVLTGTNSPAVKKPYVMSWTDKNLTVTYNGQTVTSGQELAYDPGSIVTVVYKGSAKANVSITLSENYEAPPAEITLTLGDNSVALPSGPFGRDMQFVAYATDEYTLSFADGETNGKIMIGGEVVTLPYVFTLNQADALYVSVYTVNGISDTVDLVITKKTTEEVEPEKEPTMQELLQSLMTGSYTGTWNDNTFTVIFGDGSFTITSTEVAQPGFLGSYTYYIDEDGVHTQWLSTLDGQYYDKVLTFYYVPGQLRLLEVNLPLDMELVPIITEYEENELVIGENVIEFPTKADGTVNTKKWTDKGAYTYKTVSSEVFVIQLADGAAPCFVQILKNGVTIESSVKMLSDSHYCIALSAGDELDIRVKAAPDYDSTGALSTCLVLSRRQNDNGQHTLLLGCTCKDSVFSFVSVYNSYKLNFTAPVSGKYTITCPAGFGLYPEYASSGADNYLDENNSYTFDLSEGKSRTFVLMWLWDENTGPSTGSAVVTTYHEHTFAEGWSYDGTAHWHGATCGDTSEKYGYEMHYDADLDGKCDVCAHAYHVVYNVTTKLPEGAVLIYNGKVMEDGIVRVDPAIITTNITMTVELPLTYTKDSIAATGATMGAISTSTTDYSFTLTIKELKGNATVSVTAGVPELPAATVAADQTVSFDFTDLELGSVVYVPVTFKAESAGTYYITGECPFSLTENGTASNSLMVKAEEAGEVTVYAVAGYLAEDSATTAKYSVYKLNSYELPALSGSGAALSTKLPTEVTLSFPTTDVYHITGNVIWMIGENEYVGEFYYKPTKNGEKLTVFVRNEDTESATFNIRWNAEYYHLNSANAGSNAIVPELDDFVGYTFTAQTAGAYRFKLGNGELADLYIYDNFQIVSVGDSYLVKELLAGESVTVFVRGEYVLDENGEALQEQAPIEETLIVEGLGYMPQADENGQYPAPVGQINSWMCERTGLYTIGVTGGKFSLDGTTWLESIEDMEFTQGDVLYYMVTAEAEDAEIVNVTIERKILKLNAGENSLTLRPGMEFEVCVNAMTKYVLTWSEDANVTVLAGEETLTSGQTRTETVLYITYNGEEETQVSFLAVDKSAVVASEVWTVGDHVLTMEAGVNYVITLPLVSYDEQGNLSYILTWDAADVIIYSGTLENNDADIDPEAADVVSGVLTSFANQTLYLLNTGSEKLEVSFNLAAPAVEEDKTEGETTEGETTEGEITEGEATEGTENTEAGQTRS